MPYRFNVFTGNFDYYESGSSGAVIIPEYSSDPSSPTAGQTWVLKSGGGKLKMLFGLGYPITIPDPVGGIEYQLSYRTSEGTTKRVTLS